MLEDILKSNFIILEDCYHLRARKFYLALIKFIEYTRNVVAICDEIECNEINSVRKANLTTTIKYQTIDIVSSSANIEETHKCLLDQIRGSKQDTAVILAFDSLTSLIMSFDVDRTIQLFQEILTENKNVKILAVLHTDLLNEMEIDAFRHVSDAWCKLETKNKDFLILTTLVKSSKRSILKHYNLNITDDFNMQLIIASRLKAQKGNIANSETSKSVNPLTTFNLNLKETEMEAKQSLLLPYLKKNEQERQESGRIVYYAEKEDDIDEEDPDDDLDI